MKKLFIIASVIAFFFAIVFVYSGDPYYFRSVRPSMLSDTKNAVTVLEVLFLDEGSYVDAGKLKAAGPVTSQMCERINYRDGMGHVRKEKIFTFAGTTKKDVYSLSVGDNNTLTIVVSTTTKTNDTFTITVDNPNAGVDSNGKTYSPLTFTHRPNGDTCVYASGASC
jgi:hypothetical protein